MITTLLQWRATDSGGAAAGLDSPAGGDGDAGRTGSVEMPAGDGAAPASGGTASDGAALPPEGPATTPNHLLARHEATDDELAAGAARQSFLWLDVVDPTEEDLARLRREFGFHPLTLEDVRRQEQRPKIEEYPGYYFIVFYAVRLGRRHHVVTQQISLFLGPTYLITVHAGDAPEIAESARRWERNRREVGRSLGAIVYSVLDSIVDQYFPVVDALVNQIERVEDEILDRPDRRTFARLFRLKHALLRLRRVLGPERDVLNVLIRRDAPVFDRTTGVYLQDVYDHVLRVTDTVDLSRDLLTSALDAYLSVQSNGLNQVMKRMTGISTILMSLALIAGIYGMNFRVMPETTWEYGYYAVLGVMAGLGMVLSLYFKRIGWF